MEATEHAWPTDQSQHVWGRWFNKDRTTKYRKCIHPNCTAVDETKDLG